MTSTRRTTPRYQVLAADLQQQIESGAYALGSQFPTEFEISAEHAVSRHTVRAALARLHALGLIQRRPGAGTHVTAPSPPMRYQQEVSGLDDLLQYGRSTHLELQHSARVLADPEICAALAVSARTHLVRVSCLRYGEPRAEPICITDIYLRPARGVPTTALLDPTTAVAAALKALDLCQINHVDQTFDAVSLSADAARLLGMPKHSAAMRVVRVYYAADDAVIACVVSQHPSGRFAYKMRLARRSLG